MRNNSFKPACSLQPARPLSIPVGGRSGFDIVGGIDANGCDSWPYEVAGSSGISQWFFAGTGFKSDEHAFEYGTQETTEQLDGHQLIRVVAPSATWRRVYKGFDVCTATTGGSGGSTTACIAPALLRRPDDLILYIPVGVLLAALLLFVIHFMRPAGPIRQRRHYRGNQKELANAVTGFDHSSVDGLDLKQLRKRLRRLEKHLSAEQSASQHHWFTGLMAAGRHGLALEAIARWLAELPMPIPDPVREEVLWIATSLNIEHQVRPVLDAGVLAHEAGPPELGTTSEGFDVPPEPFAEMVADAVDSLPEAFGRAMSNVAVVVEEEAQGRNLFGLYEGHPLSKYRIRQWSIHPDKITIYRRTICDHSHSEQEVRAQVYRTVIHEIAHHFGIDDTRLRELGW